ncbi:MAG: hypothetical protein H0U86_08310 [Chloroflexi bacterium]|nr:hypothetical protein [Chloroflexota bacterium]
MKSPVDVSTHARIGRRSRPLILRAGIAILIGVVAAPNIYLVGRSIGIILAGGDAVDWVQYLDASRRVTEGDLYVQTGDYGWRYSPIAAYAFGIIGIIGTAAWRLIHIAAAVAMPRLLLAVVTLVSWPLWYDIETGNTVVFFLLAGAWALTGSRLATGAYFVGLLLIPRPLMLPLAVWLLWKRPEWRLPVLGLFVIHGAAVLATGWADEWIAELIATPASIYISSTNVGPSRFVGLAWLIVGLPLGAWLTWKGRLGWASLAVSPYLLPYYLLMGLLELAPKREDARRDASLVPTGAPGSSTA